MSKADTEHLAGLTEVFRSSIAIILDVAEERIGLTLTSEKVGGMVELKFHTLLDGEPLPEQDEEMLQLLLQSLGTD